MSGMGWMRLWAAVGGFGLLASAAGPALAEEEKSGGETVVKARSDRAVMDADITKDIQAKLDNDWLLRHAAVIVATQDGVVTLIGIVDTPFAYDRAIDLATKSGGVYRVNNMLRLNYASPNAPTRN